ISINTAPTATISYGAGPFCTSGNDATVQLTGTGGGLFSSTEGLSIDANSGIIDVSASTPGDYTVTYTIAAANGCAEFTTTTTISISTAPSATITYGAGPFCTSGSDATVQLTGTGGGLFSSTAGLSIDANTGTIDVSASTPGDYTVTYTIAAANGCAEFTTTATISITAAPSATITYGAGLFSSTAGLSIDANSGTIDVSASTPGDYTVTYTIAAANGCAEFTTTATIS